MNTEEKKIPNPDEIENLPPAKRNKIKNKKVLSETDVKIRKSKRTKAGVAAFVLLLAVGVMGNWYYENSNISATIEPLISHTGKTLGEAEYVDATTQLSQDSEYFSSARVERQNARDKSLEKLQEIIDSSEQSQDAKDAATEKIAQISSNISIENKIETLVTAKGVDNCIAVISEDSSRVDIIVDVKDLSDDTVMKIKEIAMQQLGVGFENISIIQSNK